MDTRMALGGGGGGRYDTLGGGETVSRPELVDVFGLVGALARLSQCVMSHNHRLPAPPGYPQTPHTMYARFHSSEGPQKPKSVNQPHSRLSRRFGRHLLQPGLSTLESYDSRLTPASYGGTSTRARAFHIWNGADPPVNRAAMPATPAQVVSSLLWSAREGSHVAPEYCEYSLKIFPRSSSRRS